MAQNRPLSAEERALLSQQGNKDMTIGDGSERAISERVDPVSSALRSALRVGNKLGAQVSIKTRVRFTIELDS